MFPRKYRIHAFLILVALIIIFYPKYHEKPDEQKAQAATAATEEFLSLVDAGKYSESWQISASLLKQKITEQEWVDQLKKTRATVGALVERKQKNMIFSTTAKDSPDGEYILITYESSFKSIPASAETITVMLDTDKRWRIAGYFFK